MKLTIEKAENGWLIREGEFIEVYECRPQYNAEDDRKEECHRFCDALFHLLRRIGPSPDSNEPYNIVISTEANK